MYGPFLHMTNSSSSMEGHINKVIFSTCTLTCFEWQLQLMKLRCYFKIVRDYNIILYQIHGHKKVPSALQGLIAES